MSSIRYLMVGVALGVSASGVAAQAVPCDCTSLKALFGFEFIQRKPTVVWWWDPDPVRFELPDGYVVENIPEKYRTGPAATTSNSVYLQIGYCVPSNVAQALYNNIPHCYVSIALEIVDGSGNTIASNISETVGATRGAGAGFGTHCTGASLRNHRTTWPSPTTVRATIRLQNAINNGQSFVPCVPPETTSLSFN